VKKVEKLVHIALGFGKFSLFEIKITCMMSFALVSSHL